jgi:hypothetical protein
MFPYREDGVFKYTTTPPGYDTEVAQRFTAIGRPMPVSAANASVNLGLHSAPQHLPVKFRDDSVIPVVVQLTDPLGIQ